MGHPGLYWGYIGKGFIGLLGGIWVYWDKRYGVFEVYEAYRDRGMWGDIVLNRDYGDTLG